MNPLTDYLHRITKDVAGGIATEHTYRPALKSLIESLMDGITATNEPKRVQCGAPDFIVTRGQTPLGYIEAKDVGKPLGEVERSEQLVRYRDSLGNLLLTDYLEFRWYVGGLHRQTARLATVGADRKLRLEPEGCAPVRELLDAFLHADAPTVSNPKELAERMAAVARLIRYTTYEALQGETGDGSLHHQMAALREVLLHDLTEAQFADMFAQTLCYGLFAARCNTRPGVRFTREHAAWDLPKTNPFLRSLFGHVAGPDLEDTIAWAVEDLADLLHRAEISAILADFGKRTRQEDPVVHFYETFLAAYDPKMREARGVYYTPEPVVSYLVRSVDFLLQDRFGLDGLADAQKVTVKTREGEAAEVHQVQVLDPATGTGTFLHRVIDRIHETFTGREGMWSAYVRDHLLPRLFGFELLMAPYAVCHMKLGLQLKDTGYDFGTEERLRVYLTNTLEEALVQPAAASVFAGQIANEANAAKDVKRDLPILVILGNPPYSGHSANKGPWIDGLLRGRDTQTGEATASYFQVDGQPLGEKNPKWLNDDYVKFIRFAQWRIERTGYGILAIITNHGYLDNPTFRGMRQSLMTTFDDLYLLDLHGNSKKKEQSPDGGKDENVFDIQQGVAIGLFVKRPGASKQPATVRHAHLWGSRESKYHRLLESDVRSTAWTELTPAAPFYLFVPQDNDLKAEYEQGWPVSSVFLTSSLGIATARDALTVHLDRASIWDTVSTFVSLSAEEAREKYRLGEDVRDWKVDLAQKDVKSSGPKPEFIKPILYRPFDSRFTYYTGKTKGFHCMPRHEVMQHILAGDNVAMSTTRNVEIGNGWEHIFCSNHLTQLHTVSLKEVNYLFPLYLYPTGSTKTHLFDEEEPSTAHGGRRPNLAPAFIADFAARLGLSFVPDGTGDRQTTFGPEDVFAYLYAVFHAPTYRARYAEFLKSDFPRLPLTFDVDLFRSLCSLGEELVGLHLMERVGPHLPGFPVVGSNQVESVRYTEPDRAGTPGRVWINRTQYFEGVPSEVWSFHVGGYQVCEKWLKDRKGRTLTYEDLEHYRRVAAALAETIRLMSEIDAVIAAHGGWPIS